MSSFYNVPQDYNSIESDMGDPIIQDWWLVKSPVLLLSILLCYILFCAYLGPNYMKKRQPYKLKIIIAVYNFCQVLLSIFLVVKAFGYAFATNYSFKCQNIDYSKNGTKWAAIIWWYYMAKLSELLDTVFFVLRKKNNQLTFLHLYHHAVMPLMAWWTTKYAGGGGQSIPEGGLNSFIHILMYTYYFISGLGPQYQKYLWWKKYLTLLQLIQFCALLYLNFTGIFAQNCNYPKVLHLSVILNCILFFFMFGKFYITSYIKKPKIMLEKIR